MCLVLHSFAGFDNSITQIDLRLPSLSLPSLYNSHFPIAIYPTSSRSLLEVSTNMITQYVTLGSSWTEVGKWRDKVYGKWEQSIGAIHQDTVVLSLLSATKILSMSGHLASLVVPCRIGSLMLS